MFLPEFGARAHALFMGGFGYVPYFLAVVYQMVGLLPQNHPYVFPANIGRYGIRHVVAEAARNVKFSLRNIDQIVLFVAVLAGLVIFLMQFVALAAVFFLQPATAGTMPTNWLGFFYINNIGYRSQDLAFMMLDMVFGVEHPNIPNSGFFESCIGTAIPCIDNFGSPVYQWQSPTGTNGSDMQVTGTGLDPSVFGPFSSASNTYFPFPYHLGLHRIFSIYSTGLLVIAVVITSYFIATILAETMQSGVPFGRRFNKTWVPLRIVVAFGLLMPLGSGLNSSQYIVLSAAKYGSAFASNGWRYFNDSLNSNYYGELDQTSLVSVPNLPNIDAWTRFMFIARTCRVAYDYYTEASLRTPTSGPITLTDDQRVHAYLLRNSATGVGDAMRIVDWASSNYSDAMTFLDDHIDTMVIRFGVRDPDRFPTERSGVSPVCGELHIPIFDARDPVAAAPGPFIMQLHYYFSTVLMWTGNFSGTNVVGIPPETPSANRRHVNLAANIIKGFGPPASPDANIVTGVAPNTQSRHLIDARYVHDYNNQLRDWTENFINSAVAAQGASLTWGDPTNNISPLYQKGWAGAGIWYNRISEMNGSVVAAVANVPDVAKFPAVMEEVWEIKARYDEAAIPGEIFKPEVTKVDSIKALLDGVYGYEFAITMWNAYHLWEQGEGSDTKKPENNPVLSAISSILGLNGLYNLRRNQGTHPLAMLSGVGRSLVESSIRSLGYAAAISATSAVAGQYAPKQLANVSAHFFVTVAMLGLTVGFIMFYVIPFLPFIYFFFAVGGWIKGIFEAMVGAPLWALAHIRIDGHGLPGQAALNGYYLIFEVFLRPILIVFGLLASVSIYSALVSVLNTSFTLAVDNLGGFNLETSLTDSTILSLSNMRSLIDEFFYTVIYAIIVYMLGMSSFKLIDTIPNNILRWMGQSVATFGDQRENPAEGLVSKMTVGSQQATSKIGGGLGKLVGAANKV